MALLQSFEGGNVRKLRRHEVLRAEGEPASGFHLLLRGWTASSITMANGKRHLLKVHMPGDMLGMPGLAVTRSPDTIVALSSAVVTAIPREGIGRLFEVAPRIAALLFLISQEERIMLMDRLAMMAAASAIERLAGVILQLHDRAVRNNPGLGTTFSHPLTQEDLADLAGMTPIYANKTVQRLREEGLIIWERGSATILNPEALRELAGIPARQVTRELGWLPL
jgi:CRP/FNR family transcriptional regulator, anaerobic regulatory protein